MRVLLTVLLAFTLQACSAVYSSDPRTTGEEWQDTQIGLNTAGIVNKPPFRNKIRAKAAAFQGQVLLVGQSADPALTEEFVARIRALDNVDVVYNQIRQAPMLGLADISTDSWLTTRVKAALVADDTLRSVNIKVVTEAREVFLLGAVTQAQADKAADIARNIRGVNQVIKAFQYTDQR
ncbi:MULTISPECIES: BON domain-containing protein [Salinivibrio]|jgi:osmotically-inducible protein OsmY|uniref:BON domain-containing protein n=2 Tax=Salinivibrio TaxID=51366 RepID=A0ABY7LFM3_9GAMM|nr:MULTISPECIES: BON domain-containing protein [Salinivibrio]ODQ01618.1 hemolysin [Salinivibrio sp. DV]OOF12524.1 hemolysin [Salinivibrio sp. PR5]OOF13040.1 hemolysin [Salinivibrio sp. PR919]OOF18528.1 hemolysin [Salinivibrio sp. PR932]OOF31533.1 hemolysin [Salinivibrio proteolyticus]